MPDGKTKKTVKKVVLAYSGGLDTSIILKWLQTTYGCEVVTFTADLGQGEELAPAREKALLLGIKKENIFVEDLNGSVIVFLRHISVHKTGQCPDIARPVLSQFIECGLSLLVALFQNC